MLNNVVEAVMSSQQLKHINNSNYLKPFTTLVKFDSSLMELSGIVMSMMQPL